MGFNNPDQVRRACRTYIAYSITYINLSHLKSIPSSRAYLRNISLQHSFSTCVNELLFRNMEQHHRDARVHNEHGRICSCGPGPFALGNSQFAGHHGFLCVVWLLHRHIHKCTGINDCDSRPTSPPYPPSKRAFSPPRSTTSLMVL